MGIAAPKPAGPGYLNRVHYDRLDRTTQDHAKWSLKLRLPSLFVVSALASRAQHLAPLTLSANTHL